MGLRVARKQKVFQQECCKKCFNGFLVCTIHEKIGTGEIDSLGRSTATMTRNFYLFLEGLEFGV